MFLLYTSLSLFSRVPAPAITKNMLPNVYDYYDYYIHFAETKTPYIILCKRNAAAAAAV